MWLKTITLATGTPCGIVRPQLLWLLFLMFERAFCNPDHNRERACVRVYVCVCVHVCARMYVCVFVCVRVRAACVRARMCPF